MDTITVFGHKLTLSPPTHPFYCAGAIRDHFSGQPLGKSGPFGDIEYSGPVLVGQTLFRTWVSNGERNWAI